MAPREHMMPTWGASHIVPPCPSHLDKSVLGKVKELELGQMWGYLRPESVYPTTLHPLSLSELLDCEELHDLVRLVLKAGNYMNEVRQECVISPLV